MKGKDDLVIIVDVRQSITNSIIFTKHSNKQKKQYMLACHFFGVVTAHRNFLIVSWNLL